jgi:hypothetical protein
MQIKVEANDMYTVLTGHGIDATEAKAIILDLLLSAEGTVLGGSTATQTADSVNLDDESYETSEDLEEPADGADLQHLDSGRSTSDASVGKVQNQTKEKTQNKSKITRKRLNFGAFGGTADSLT